MNSKRTLIATTAALLLLIAAVQLELFLRDKPLSDDEGSILVGISGSTEQNSTEPAILVALNEAITLERSDADQGTVQIEEPVVVTTRTNSDSNTLEVYFSQIYDGYSTAQIRARYKELFTGINVDEFNIRHTAKLSSGDYVEVGETFIDEDGMKVLPLSSARRASDRPFLNMYHEAPNGKLVRTDLSVEEVPWAHDQLMELEWLRNH